MDSPTRARFARLGSTLLPGLVMLGLCLYGLGRREAWRDEHATWWATTLEPAQFWHLMSNIDAVLAPYYLLERGWVQIAGDSLASLRFPSSLAMTGCALLVVALGTRLASARVGGVAALLLAALPSVSRYGQEARPYAFAMAASCAALLLLLRAVERPERRLRWAAYALASSAIAAFHLVALSSLLAHLCVVLEPAPRWPSAPRRALLRPWLRCALLVLTLVAPFALLAHGQRAQVAWTRTEPAALLKLPQMIFHARNVGIVVLLVGLCGLRLRDPVRRVLGAWALGATLLLYLSHPLLHFFIHRYLLFTLPAWCLLAALAAEDLVGALARWRSARVVVPGLLLGVVVVLGLKEQRKLRDATRTGSQHPYAAIAAALRSKLQPGDAIAYGGAGNAPNWARTAMYFELQELEQARLPRDVFVTRGPAEAGWLTAEECRGRGCLPAEVERLWFVTTDPRDQLFQHVAAERRGLLASQFAVAEVTPLSKLTLALLVRHKR